MTKCQVLRVGRSSSLPFADSSPPPVVARIAFVAENQPSFSGLTADEDSHGRGDQAFDKQNIAQ
jgi:hypothetical protein